MSEPALQAVSSQYQYIECLCAWGINIGEPDLTLIGQTTLLGEPYNYFHIYYIFLFPSTSPPLTTLDSRVSIEMRKKVPCSEANLACKQCVYSKERSLEKHIFLLPKQWTIVIIVITVAIINSSPYWVSVTIIFFLDWGNGNK